MTENIESALIAYMNEVARLNAERNELLEALEIALDRLVENNCDTDDEYEWTSKIRAAIARAREN